MQALARDLRDPAALPRAALALAAIAVLWPGLRLVEFDPAALLDDRSRAVFAKFLGGFLPLETSGEFLRLVLVSTVETVAMATAGVSLAIAVALPLSMLVSSSLSIGRIGPRRGLWAGRLLRAPLRWLLILLRSVPEVIWALLLVRALGLGPAAGVLAIAVTYSGMMGKVFFEIYEAGDQRPSRALLQAGSGRMGAFLYGILPGALPEMVSYTLYRWECAVRASVVMGFVGAGGLGMQMELSLRMLAGGEVATILAAFFALALFADMMSWGFRRCLA